MKIEILELLEFDTLCPCTGHVCTCIIIVAYLSQFLKQHGCIIVSTAIPQALGSIEQELDIVTQMVTV